MMKVKKLNCLLSALLVALFLVSLRFEPVNAKETSTVDIDGQPSADASSRIIRQNLFERTGGSVLLERATNLTSKIIAAGRCRVDVCFALDGSASLSPLEYQYQKEFASLISTVIAIDRGANYAAVQYGSANVGISTVTNNVTKFVNDIAQSQFAMAKRTFVAAGLLFCTNQLDDKTENKDKIVLFGDGGVNFGLDPLNIAKKFLPPTGNGSILAVGVGGEQQTNLAQITGRSDAFVSISNQANLPDTLEKAIDFLCEL